MRKTIVATAVGLSLAAGTLAGTVIGTPSLAGAAQTATGAVGWVEEALSGLVENGTITEAQADAVEGALQEARPERPHRHGHARMHIQMAVAAEALGITEGELRAALVGGQTIAEIAAAQNVEIDAVIGALMATHEERIAAKVEAGDLTQEEAEARLEVARERVTAMVNGEMPQPRRGGR
jgi:hypothetical protein